MSPAQPGRRATSAADDERPRIALVTGAASGIGCAVAFGLAADGVHVALADRDEPGLRASVAALGRRGGVGRCFPCDLSERDAAAELARRVDDEMGPVGILVNSAGVTGRRGAFADVGRDEWDAIHGVNLAGAVFLTQAVVPMMTSAAGSGRIVNVTSASAHRARAFSVAYAASKAGLEGATRALAGELAPHGVTVNAVAPGITATGIHPDSESYADLEQRARSGPASNLLGRVASADDVAAMITFLCGSGGDHITGQVIHVSAGSIV